MLKMHEQDQIFKLADAGCRGPEISKMLRVSPTTVYKYLRIHRQKDFVATQSKEKSVSKKLFPFKEFLDTRIKVGITNSSKLYQELLGKRYKGSYVLVNNYVKSNSNKQSRYKRSQQVNTGPGEQVQVDWGSFGKITINDRIERLYAFVYVLSFSRAMYVEFVVRQNQQTFQNCHINAFEKLGIPKTILYDNIKTVVLSREKAADGSKKIHYNPAFLDFSSYYGFQPELCPPYWPRSKGKVESGVKYVRNNFMKGMIFGKTFKTIEEINKKATRWIEQVAQQRIHGTTKETPCNSWLREKEFLTFPIKIPRYETAPFMPRHSTKDGLVQYKSSFYSVPTEFSRKKLYVRDISKHGVSVVEIYSQDILIASHAMSSERGKWVVDDDHMVTRNARVGRKKKKSQRKQIDITVKTRSLDYYNILISQKNHGSKES